MPQHGCFRLALQVLLLVRAAGLSESPLQVHGDCSAPQSLQVLLVLLCCTPCSAPLTVLVLYRWLPLQVHTLRAELDAVNDDRLRLRGDLAEVKEQV